MGDAIETVVGKGSVILWEDFEFYETGEKKNSHFLVLSDCRNRSFIAIRATATTSFYERGDGTMTKSFLMIPRGVERVFTKKVAIDFTKIKVLHLEKMESIWGNGIRKLGSVSAAFINEIDKFVTSSKVIERNWKHWILDSQRIS